VDQRKVLDIRTAKERLGTIRHLEALTKFADKSVGKAQSQTGRTLPPSYYLTDSLSDLPNGSLLQQIQLFV
jgi:hypothetical protein